jgi:hypothetical protein
MDRSGLTPARLKRQHGSGKSNVIGKMFQYGINAAGDIFLIYNLFASIWVRNPNPGGTDVRIAWL